MKRSFSSLVVGSFLLFIVTSANASLNQEITFYIFGEGGDLSSPTPPESRVPTVTLALPTECGQVTSSGTEDCAGTAVQDITVEIGAHDPAQHEAFWTQFDVLQGTQWNMFEPWTGLESFLYFLPLRADVTVEDAITGERIDETVELNRLGFLQKSSIPSSGHVLLKDISATTGSVSCEGDGLCDKENKNVAVIAPAPAPASVPEPMVLALFGPGLIALAYRRRKLKSVQGFHNG